MRYALLLGISVKKKKNQTFLNSYIKQLVKAHLNYETVNMEKGPK